MRLLKLLSALVIVSNLNIMPTSAMNLIDELSLLMKHDASRAPTALDSLFIDLALGYGLCSSQFELAAANRDKSAAQTEVLEAKKCQTEMVSKGDLSISKIKTELKKPEAQAALKDLALYWHIKMSDVSVSHSEADGAKVLRELKAHVERVRLETNW